MGPWQKSGVAGVLHHAKRLVIIVMGATLLLFGAMLLFTPGPGIVVLFLALTVLATEFIWARRFLKRMKKRLSFPP